MPFARRIARRLTFRRVHWIRLLLVCCLGPIVYAACTLARSTDQSIWDLAISEDGTTLACLIGKTRPRLRDEPRLQVWDLATSQVLVDRVLDKRATCLALSPDGNTLAVGYIHRVLLWDLETRRIQRTIVVPQIGLTTLQFTPGASGLLARSREHPGLLLDLQREGQVILPSQSTDELWGANRQGSLAAMMTSPTWTEVYDISERHWRRVAALPSHGRTALSSDGRRAVVFDGRRLLQFWDCVSQRAVNGVNVPMLSDIEITADDQRAVTATHDGRVIWWHLQSGRQLQQLQASNSPVWFIALTPDGRRIVTADGDAAITLWDPQAGVRLNRLRPWVSPQTVLGILIAAYLIWCLLWVRSGLGERAAVVPGADVFFLHTMLLMVLVYRLFVSGDPQDTSRPVAMWTLAVLGCLFCLLILWAVAGPWRWSLRIGLLIAGAAIGWSLLVLIWRSDLRADLRIAVASAGLMAGLLAGLLSGRRNGARIIHRSAATRAPGQGGARATQLPLRDLFLWTAAVALLAAITRLARPELLPLESSLFHLGIGLSLATTAVATIWASLSERQLVLRLLAAAAVALGGSSLTQPFYSPTQIWIWHTTLHLALAGLLAGSLLVFRSHGYRLQWLSNQPHPSDEPGAVVWLSERSA